MNLGRCPVCHSHISLEAIVQDDAGRELLAMLAGLDADLARPLVAYLGLFRPPRQDLRNVRAHLLRALPPRPPLPRLQPPAPAPERRAHLAESLERLRVRLTAR